MRCAEFQAWLDEGMPWRAGGAGGEHARDCARCAESLEAARAIEALLALEPPPVPARAAFTDRVMARVQALERLHARTRATAPSDPYAWWVRAAMEPASILSLFLAALVVWQWDAVLTLARTTIASAATIDLSGILARVAALTGYIALDRPELALGVNATLVAALLWLAYALYRFTERLLTPGPR
jgi:hypothetical protein